MDSSACTSATPHNWIHLISGFIALYFGSATDLRAARSFRLRLWHLLSAAGDLRIPAWPARHRNPPVPAT